jgi:hypothetical protein
MVANNPGNSTFDYRQLDAREIELVSGGDKKPLIVKVELCKESKDGTQTCTPVDKMIISTK